jgi:hypothetical protein
VEFTADTGAEDEDEGVTTPRRLLVEGLGESMAGDEWALAGFLPFLSRLTGGSVSSSSEELLNGWNSL